MINMAEYKERRKKLAQSLPKDSVAIVFAANEQIRNGDAHFRFRQDSNFYYLTGFNEPQAILVIDTNTLNRTLFNKASNPSEEVWNGKILGQEGALLELNVDVAYAITDITTHLPKLIANKKSLYYDFSQLENYEQYIYPALIELQKAARTGISAPTSMCDIKPELSELRLIKSGAEIELIKKATSISVNAHKHAAKMLRELENEAEIEAEFLYELHKLGCRNVAYESIVAAGNNACTLHYIDNNQKLDK
ncbi:MAG: M24 family metallopeptidase, partial [Chitinophagia bacterium]|nr:M24 family metallopeptidase [Chitinophagia bacterium]